MKSCPYAPYLKMLIDNTGYRVNAVAQKLKEPPYNLDIKPFQLYRILNGKQPAHADEYLAICKFLKIDPYEYEEWLKKVRKTKV